MPAPKLLWDDRDNLVDLGKQEADGAKPKPPAAEAALAQAAVAASTKFGGDWLEAPARAPSDSDGSDTDSQHSRSGFALASDTTAAAKARPGRKQAATVLPQQNPKPCPKAPSGTEPIPKGPPVKKAQLSPTSKAPPKQATPALTSMGPPAKPKQPRAEARAAVAA